MSDTPERSSDDGKTEPPPGNNVSENDQNYTPGKGEANGSRTTGTRAEEHTTRPQDPAVDPQTKTLFDQFLKQFASANEAFNTFGGEMYVKSPVYHYHDHRGAQAHSPSGQPNDPGTIPNFDFLALAEVFVETSAYDTAWGRLRERNVVIISGRTGTGRRTLAYRLADRLYQTHDVGIRQLTSYRSIVDCSDDEFRQIEGNRVYVLVLDSPDGVNQATFDRLVHRVTSKSSYLIIVGSDEIVLHLNAVARMRMDGPAVPRPYDVFRAHLQRYLGMALEGTPSTQTVEVLCSNPALVKILSEAPELRRAAELAAVVSELLCQRQSMDDILAKARQYHANWLSQCAREYVQEAQYSRAQLCLLIAAAVLHNVDVDDFWLLAERLRQLMGNEFNEEDRAHWQRLKRAPSSVWLAAARSRSEKDDDWYDDRLIQVDVIRSDPPKLNHHLIGAFWNEYHQLRGTFCQWLFDLGKESDLSQRTRTAIAFTVGTLLVNDPAWVDHAIIREWLLNESYLPQDTGAMSIRFATERDKGVSRQWLRRLERWDQDKETRPRLIFASALIYSWLSAHEPREFIRRMDKLIRGDDAWVLNVKTHGDTTTIDGSEQRQPAVRIAFLRAMQLGGFHDANYTELFRYFQTWVMHDAVTPRRIARQLIVDLMLFDLEPDMQAQIKPSGQDADTVFVPVLLDIVYRYQHLLKLAGELVGEAMSTRRSFRMCRNGIYHLLSFASHQPAYQPTLECLLLNLCESYPTPEYGQREMLHDWLRSWVQSCEQEEEKRFGKQIARKLYEKGLI